MKKLKRTAQIVMFALLAGQAQNAQCWLQPTCEFLKENSLKVAVGVISLGFPICGLVHTGFDFNPFTRERTTFNNVVGLTAGCLAGFAFAFVGFSLLAVYRARQERERRRRG